ncbi:acyltransferase family protein [Parafilimonas terrae]|uniref:Peptidoglycan/LPS O-acetylase OafA/YrhL, contains acyltransferase and SGNH-hydrolase domains n=1 Tax=Parafilimonas terrae TaxID=1465490 RepID=A0A1I5WFP6_9BACT|nr:acyltransferase [Parafilimonas terrae]SFQ18574.1 Peptidoglycan/LPS O-acetylase OafA/YrhL, contains acyltransferase and SGNH-hydrolase domains [Parafilimonas terrae]
MKPIQNNDHLLSNKEISGSKSIVLDVLRIAAAITVLIHHAIIQWGFAGYLDKDWGHTAVVVFFVLSGYVIAYTTFKNRRSWKQYAQARLSKLYSVLIPCLIITSLVQLYVYYNSSNLFEGYSRGDSFIRYILSALYLNEIWFFSAAPPINGPLWSLSFEFWYYCLCGVCMYARSTKFFYLLLAGICLLAGPKILLMLPVWMMGYFAYRMPEPGISYRLRWVTGILLMLMPVFLMEILPAMPFTLGKKPLYFTNQFFTDYIIGFTLSAGIWLLPNVEAKKVMQHSLNAVMRRLANLTFPLYLLHAPLFILYRSIFGTDEGNWVAMLAAIMVVLISSLAIGFFINKTHIYWKKYFALILQKIIPENRLKTSGVPYL